MVWLERNDQLLAVAVAESVRDFLEGVESFFSSLPAIDWALIIVGCFALWWIFASVRSVTRLGPLEVDTLEHDGKEHQQADVKALTAMFRESLATSGLAPPTEVPSSTPETDLLTAIEASNIPQGAWVARLLQMLPKPPGPTRYRVTGTLFGKANSSRGGISFWLRPSRAGSEMLETVEKGSHGDAVECAAAMIFVHISNDAVYVFPSWARWRKSEALECYLKGVRARARQDYRGARLWFERARDEEPRNLLARMQLASLDERMASTTVDKGPVWPTGARSSTRMFRSNLPSWVIRGRALGAYLEAAVERPDVVEARYRAGILAATLATWCTNDQAAVSDIARRRLIREIGLRNVSPGELAPRLTTIAERESEAAHQMLQPWYVLLRFGRLRHRYEMRGLERRELKRAVSITRHCLRVRKRLGDTDLIAKADLAWRRCLVRLLYLMPGASLGWQPHYNAGCFYSLLHERESLKRDPDKVTLRRLRKRAYKHLNLASAEGRDRLDGEWLAKGDADLKSVRKLDEEEWRVLLRRHRGAVDSARDIRTYPDRAWGRPLLRKWLWVIFAAALAAGIVATIVVALSFWETIGLLLLVSAATTWAVLRGLLAHRERQIEQQAEADAAAAGATPAS